MEKDPRREKVLLCLNMIAIDRIVDDEVELKKTAEKIMQMSYREIYEYLKDIAEKRVAENSEMRMFYAGVLSRY